MIQALFDWPTPRALAVWAALAVCLLLAPLVVGSYALSVLVLVLYFAYVGQAWNVMMGFAGQLSLGHSLYIGVGAYVSAVLFVRYGVSPWAGAVAAMAICAVIGAVIGFLAFRFSISGVYFALLTIAFAEFSRIGFDHISFVGASAGLFLPVAQRTHNDLLHLRGSPVMFYYVMLALSALALFLCRALRGSKTGYYWLAIREDQEAAQALGIDIFGYKMRAVVLSAAMTSLGGVFFAFYYNNLFPEQIFAINRSIELILGPIIGGLGTLVGPLLGAFVLTVLAESLRSATDALGLNLPGLQLLFYGVCLMVVIIFLPNGIWPALKGRLGFDDDRRSGD
ncbi:MAG TPA: branched-chain amino acid ABC transporter permease [Candidatus Cybelea sp.]|nr:branched-chain amino acid ABC transporter permease [Candidatus Cybelea sp.]